MSGTILIGADVAPTGGSETLFAKGEAGALLTDGLLELWQSADARIFNLECPLSDRQTPIEKCGPAMRAPLACIEGIAALQPSAVALANNHILDQGGAGLHDTLTALQGKAIPAFGAGATAAQADAACYLEIGGVRTAVYALCEHEYSVAEGENPGANGLDELTLADRMRALRRECDCLIVLYHGGREYYPYPSPKLQRRCRLMVSCGAGAVLCQHSHCIGSGEVFEGAPIVYGTGNFLFDLDGEPAAFDMGLLVQLTVDKDGVSAAYVPIARKAHGAALLHGAQAQRVLTDWNRRSEQLTDPAFVAAQYQKYAGETREKMIKVFLSGNPLLKAVNVLYGRRPSRVYPRQTQLAIRNSLACESLLELLTEGLK